MITVPEAVGFVMLAVALLALSDLITGFILRRVRGDRDVVESVP